MHVAFTLQYKKKPFLGGTPCVRGVVQGVGLPPWPDRGFPREANSRVQYAEHTQTTGVRKSEILTRFWVVN